MNQAGEKLFVEEIREGREVVSAFLFDDLRLGQTRGGKPFVGLKLKDRTGSMEARVWDDALKFFDSFSNGDVVLVKGSAESFQGKIQIKVTQAQTVSPDQIDYSYFLPASPYDVEEMFAELLSLVRGVADPDLRALLEDILGDTDLASRLKRAPAAKRFHHAYIGGLLEHTLAVTRAAAALSLLYPALHRDLLLAGAVIHDLGKVREFDLGISGDYSDEGRLLGHIVLGVEMVEKRLAARPDFPPDLALLLKHLIASHHGEQGFGSPKRPKILEALALHHLDDLDAKINGIGGFIERHVDERTGWTDYNRLMERFFYRPELPVFESPKEKENRKPAAKADPNQLSLLDD